MRFLRACFCTVFALLVAACATSEITRGQADFIKAGEGRDQALQRLGKSEPTVSHSFEHQRVKYLAEHYALQTGFTQMTTVVCTPTCIPIPVTVPVLTPFVIVYTQQDNKVLVSGTIEELSKSENSQVSGLMPELKDSHAKALAAKRAR